MKRWKRMLRKTMTPGRNQGGFSIVEVLVAGLVLTMVTLPLMQLFGTSIRLSSTAADLNKAEVCLRNYSEIVWSRSFYTPYNSEVGETDMDDFYWEAVSGSRGLDNSWDDQYEVEVKDYDQDPYPQFRITVNMAFLNDDMTLASMWGYWGPKGKSSTYASANTDDPSDDTNMPINLIKFEVKAYYMDDNGAEKSNSTTSVMTRTQAQANLGVSAIEVISQGGDTSKQGSTSNSAPHNVNSIPLKITGYGFDASSTACLTMQGHDDIPITLTDTSEVQDGILWGSVNLASVNNLETMPWASFGSYAEPGGWDVRLDKESAYAILYQGFVVEFPEPVIDEAVSSETNGEIFPVTAEGNFQDVAGSVGSFAATIKGNPILAWNSSATYPVRLRRCYAVMQLVWCNADGTVDRTRVIQDRYLSKEDIQSTPTSIVSGNNYTGGADSDTITDQFNLRGRSTEGWDYPFEKTVVDEDGVVTTKNYQRYYVEVWNCRDYDRVGQLGDRVGISTFYVDVEEPQLSVYRMYDTSVYTAFGGFRRNWGFKNKTYNLTIEGKSLDVQDNWDEVKVYLGAAGIVDMPLPSVGYDPETWEPIDEWGGTLPEYVAAGDIQYLSSDLIEANFNLNGFNAQVSPSECWLYLYNTVTHQQAYLDAVMDSTTTYAYLVRNKPTITTIRNTATGANSGWYYNYYDLGLAVTGTGFLPTDKVYYQKNDGTGTRYEIGVGDGEAAAAITTTTVAGELNLIQVPCVVGGTLYKLWVVDPYEPGEYVGSTFTVQYGAPTLLAASSGAVTIRYYYWLFANNYYYTVETASAKAWGKRYGDIKMMLKGKGFLDSTTGSNTSINIEADGSNGVDMTGQYVAIVDRVNHSVLLYTVPDSTLANWNSHGSFSPNWNVNSGTGDYDITLTNSIDSQSTPYTNRWTIKSLTSGNPSGQTW